MSDIKLNMTLDEIIIKKGLQRKRKTFKKFNYNQNIRKPF